MLPATDLPQLIPKGRMSDRRNARKEEVQREVVATNEMGIVKAGAVHGKIDLTYVDWGTGQEVPKRGYWWRWKWDIGNHEVSQL